MLLLLSQGVYTRTISFCYNAIMKRGGGGGGNNKGSVIGNEESGTY